MAPTCTEEGTCDDTYEAGAVVENRFGSWRYQGNNQWQTLGLAEGVNEITSGFGNVWHRLNHTVGYEYHDFGDRPLAGQMSFTGSSFVSFWQDIMWGVF